MVRAHRLNNGDIFTVLNKRSEELTIEFEDKQLYEVVVGGFDEFGQPTWIRTGVKYTIEDINEFVR